MFETLSTIAEAMSNPSKAFSKLGQGVAGRIEGMFGVDKPEAVEESREVTEKAELERKGIFAEFFKGSLLREMPMLAGGMELAKKLIWGSSTKEAHGFENEFETISAMLLFLPDSWKKMFTDLILQLPMMKTMIEYWPLMDGLVMGNNIRKKALEGNPTAVIQALKIMHQDFITGKVSFEDVYEKMNAS